MVLHYDDLIIGSGFGGSVSALRLAEKGWRVGVAEQGKRVGPSEIRAAKRNIFRLMWMPGLGMRGYFVQIFFRHLGIVGGVGVGVGVGGGSLVWSAVMLEPKPEFYREPALQKLGRPRRILRSRHVVLSAGVLGTLELLFRNRDEYRTLPCVSATLGQVVRTNSEAITAVLHPAGEDLSDGTAISTDFHPDKNTHITQNRFDRGYRFMRSFMVPMTDGENKLARALKTMVAICKHPRLMLSNWFARDWEKRITAFTVMQDLDNALSITFRRKWWRLFRRGMTTRTIPGQDCPSYLPIANEVTREYARTCGRQPLSTGMEAIGGLATTAHILSGCPMGHDARDSVIDTNHQVHGHPGLYVVDGSSIPANIGVNPSLTIAAMAERFAQRQSTASDAGP